MTTGPNDQKLPGNKKKLKTLNKVDKKKLYNNSNNYNKK